MARNIRVRLAKERATKLLRDWSADGRPLSLRIVIDGKFNLGFSGGKLSEIGKNTGIFFYVSPGIVNMVSHEGFKRREREETDALERLIFSDSNFANVMQVIRSKDKEPVLIENLSPWVN